MCDAPVSANVQSSALKCEKLNNLLEVNCGHSIPEESTLRKKKLLLKVLQKHTGNE
jgi:hypothetical protein